MKHLPHLHKKPAIAAFGFVPFKLHPLPSWCHTLPWQPAALFFPFFLPAFQGKFGKMEVHIVNLTSVPFHLLQRFFNSPSN